MTDGQLFLGDLDLLRAPYTAEVGSSFGAWESVTSTTSSLFLDGAIVSGEASSNREVVLRVRVESGDRYSLIEACEALLTEANKASNVLTFSHPDGPTLVYEVFRVQSPERDDDESEAWNRRTYVLTFPARPFARSTARETTGALAPTIKIADFESSFTGALLVVPPNGLEWSAPVGSATATPIANQAAASTGFLTAVSNCTVGFSTTGATNNDSHADITMTAGGTCEVVSATTWALSGDVVTGGARVVVDTDSAPTVMAGIEWLDASSNSLGITWGAARTFTQNTVGKDHYVAAWVAAAPRSGAAQARLRLRFDRSSVNPRPYRVATLLLIPSTFGTVTPVAQSAYSGATGISMSIAHTSTFATDESAGYLYRALAATVDISAKAMVGFWLRARSRPGYDASLRLVDSAGNWSRWTWDSNSDPAAGTWVNLTGRLDSPDAVSPNGAANLTAIAAFDISARGGASSLGYYDLDSLTAGDAPSGTNSSRGTVYDLSPIKGSARTTAQVKIDAGLNLTDFLLAAVPADNGFPLLSVSNGTATAPAPAKYDGVYSIIGATPSGVTSIGTSCTITQMIGGNTVATKTLTGTARSGNHYIDFGAVALPLVAVPDDNQSVSYTFGFAAGSGGEVLVIDVDASLAWVDNLTTAMPYAWVDEPDATAALGHVWVGTASDRTDARALLNPPTLSRPLQVMAPATRLLVYSTTTAPNVTLDYYPRWLIEPTA